MKCQRCNEAHDVTHIASGTTYERVCLGCMTPRELVINRINDAPACEEDDGC